MRRLACIAFLLVVLLIFPACAGPAPTAGFPSDIENGLFSSTAHVLPVPPARSAAAPPSTAPAPATTAPDISSNTSASPPAVPQPQLRAPAALLIDEGSGQTIFARNADQIRPPASLTKLLTAVVALDLCGQDAVYTVGEEIDLVAADASRAGLCKGMRLTTVTLLRALLLRSGGDAAYVFAAAAGRRAAGDDHLPPREAVAAFAREMNEAALSIGARNSHFVTPDGYHDPEHISTARDLLLIARYARSFPLIRETVRLPSVQEFTLSGERFPRWDNTNALLRPDSGFYLAGVTGMKTGHTDEAGWCVLFTAEREGHLLMGVVMGCPDSATRWSDAAILYQMAEK